MARSLSDLFLPRPQLEADPWVVREVHGRTRRLAQRYGLLEEHARSEELFERGRFALLATLAYGDQDVDIVSLCNDFNTYLFFVDDRAEENEDYGKRPELLRYYFESHVHLMSTGDAPWDEDPAIMLLEDIRGRLATRMSPGWLARFSENLSEYLIKGTLVGAQHWTAGSTPTLRGYLQQRAWDSAVFCSQDLLELSCGELPEEVLDASWFERARLLCTQVVAFTNDLVSYPKEVMRQESPNNLVHVLMRRDDKSLEDAAGRVIEMVNDAVVDFTSVYKTRASYSPRVERQLKIYREGQEAWMRANLIWSRATERYIDSNSLFAELSGRDRVENRPAVDNRAP